MGVEASWSSGKVEKIWNNIFSHSKSEILSLRKTVPGIGKLGTVLNSAKNLISHIKHTVKLTSKLFLRMTNNH